MEEPRGKVLERTTLCTADCEPEEGYHVSTWVTCQRCGARLHSRLYRVETVSGEELVVGAECMKAVVGFRWGKAHDKAEKLRPLLRQLAADGFTHIVFFPWAAVKQVWATKGNLPGGWFEVWVREGKVVALPMRAHQHLLRAGADLGLWTRTGERGRFCGDKAEWHEITA